MKKRFAIAAGGLAVAVAAAIPASGAFGCVYSVSPHCQKVLGAIATASGTLSQTNSNSSTAQGALTGAGMTYSAQKCA